MSLLNRLMEKVENGTATPWERAEFRRLSAEYMDYGDEPECRDEDMNYWYERGCPVDDCPGFRGDKD